MKITNLLFLLGAIVLSTFMSCQKTRTCEEPIPSTLEQLVEKHQTCEISECELDGEMYYKVAYMTTWDDGTPWQEVRAYTLEGEDMGICGWCGTPPLSLCQRLQDCNVVYRSPDFDPENQPAVDVYGVKGTVRTEKTT